MTPRSVSIFALPLPFAGLVLGLYHLPPVALILAFWCFMWAVVSGLGLLGAIVRLATEAE